MLYVNLRKHVEETPEGKVALDRDTFNQLLQAAIAHTQFDEYYYLNKNPDVAEAVRKGTVKSAHEHFVQSGYKEGRLPRAIPVDEPYYLSADSILRQMVERGDMTVREHFERYGSGEGRSPFNGFNLFQVAFDN